MKLLLLFFCVNLSSGSIKNETEQEGGVNLSSGMLWSETTLEGGLTTTPAEINNMLNAIQSTPITEILGDSFNSECVYNQRNKRTGIDSRGFHLDLWSAVTCTFVVTQLPQQYARLYLPHHSAPGVSIQTLYLPLHGYNTASFMLVPRTMSPNFFVTATLTGCDIFVATADNLNCPVVVIHTNACGTMTTDVNQQEAIAVLSLDICHGQGYQIQYRVASRNHQSIIDHARYHYTTQYYNQGGIFFGYTFGGTSVATRQPWYFCYKTRATTGMTCNPIP